MGWFVMINVLNLFFSLSYFLFWTNNYTLSLNLRIVNLIKLIPFNLYNCEKLTKNSVKTNIFTQHKFLHKFFLNWYKLFLCSSKNINYCDSILKIYYKYIYYYYLYGKYNEIGKLLRVILIYFTTNFFHTIRYFGTDYSNSLFIFNVNGENILTYRIKNI